MAEAKHTPGPWRVDGEHLRAMVRGDDATIVAVRHRLPAEINAANMRLIAAAPDMLESLRLARDDLERVACDGDDFSDTLAAIDAAVSKATGAQ